MSGCFCWLMSCSRSSAVAASGVLQQSPSILAARSRTRTLAVSTTASPAQRLFSTSHSVARLLHSPRKPGLVSRRLVTSPRQPCSQLPLLSAPARRRQISSSIRRNAEVESRDQKKDPSANQQRRPEQQEQQQQQQQQEQPQQKTVVQQTKELRQALKQKLSGNLAHENIYNLPNALTVSRLLLTPVIGYLVLHDQHAWAVGLFVYAGTTDLIDGWLARRWQLQTVVGSVIDPMADKLLMTVLTVCLALKGALPVYLATLILGRDVSLAVAAIYYRWASLPRPRTLLRYWDFSLPSAEVKPTAISKYNTALQLLLIGGTLAVPLVSSASVESLTGGAVDVQTALTAAQALVAATTVWSGASYLYTRDAVRILGDLPAADKKHILRQGRRVIAGSFAACLALALYLES